MVSRVNLLFLLDPTEASNVDTSEKKLNQILVMADKRWRVDIIGSTIVHYENPACDFTSHKVSLTGSPDSLVARVLYDALLVPKSVGIIKKHDVHAIMCTAGHMYLGLPAYVISRMTGRKCIVRVNENAVLEIVHFVERNRIPILRSQVILRTIEKLSRKVEAWLFQHVDWTVTHGPMDYERIKRITSKVSFIPLWVDASKFRAMPKNHVAGVRKRLGLSDDKVVLFVGRLQHDKNLATLLTAFRKLLEIRNDAVLVVIGRGDEEEKCRDLAYALGIANNVKFLGYIKHDQIVDFYNAADVYVLPSLWEEWSNTIMEAMACGTPVIATNVGANPYLVRDGETGLLFSPMDSLMLAEKMAYVFNHPNEIDEISLNARMAMGKYTKQDIGNLYKTVIERVISEGQGS